MKINKKFEIVAKIEKRDNGITVVASDETLDRHGEVLKIADWDLTEFRKAPRMLIDHDHRVEKIVGAWRNPRIQDGELLLDADFHEITELSKAVSEMVKEGYLNTVSVGAIYKPAQNDGDRPTLELIETSWVTVGANPNARVKKALETEEVEKEVEITEYLTNVEKDVEEVEKIAILEQKNNELQIENDSLKNKIKDLEEQCEKHVQTLTEMSQKNKALRKGLLTKLMLKSVAQQVNRKLQQLNKL